MANKQIPSTDIKRSLLYYFRYIQENIYICTECKINRNFIADILFSNSSSISEVEVKTTYSDFIADFSKENKSHKLKHEEYLKERNNSYALYKIPNKFYFAIPQSLYPKCSQYLKDNPQYSKYGIIIYRANYPDNPYPSTEGRIKIVKSAKFIHNELPDKEMVKIIVKRMSAELIKLYWFKIYVAIYNIMCYTYLSR